MTVRSGINILNDLTGGRHPKAVRSIDDIDKIYDGAWIHRAFMVTIDDLEDKNDKFNFTSSRAMFKFSDSVLGGGDTVNPRPQHTRYADLPTAGSLNRQLMTVGNPNGKFGQGRIHSETMDDHNHRIYMTFGLVEFNSLLRFFFTFSNASARSWATTGHDVSILRTVGDVFGTYFAVFSPMRWAKKIALGGLVVRAGMGVLGALDNSFYSLNPTMGSYWLSVGSILNDVAVNLDFTPTRPGEDKSLIRKMGKTQELDPDGISELAKEIPGIVGEDGYINVFNLVRRNYTLKRISYTHQRYASEKGDTVYNGYLADRDKDGKIIERELPSSPPNTVSVINTTTAVTRGLFKSIVDFHVKYVELVGDLHKTKQASSVSGTVGATTELIADGTDVILDGATSVVAGIWDNIWGNIKEANAEGGDDFKGQYNEDGKFIGDGTSNSMDSIKKAILLENFVSDNGLTYVVLEVDEPSSPTESFTNSVESSPIKDSINMGASIGRKMKFSLAGGNIAGGAVQYVTDSLADLATGAANGFTFGITNFIENLFHGVNAEVPNQWSGSESSLSSVDYKMTLTSPYPNAYSQIQNLYYPLACILAGVFPLKAGNRSHVSPYLVRLFDRGTNIVNLGIISSVSVARAVTNVGYTTDVRPLSFEVTFTVTNLEEILSMPMASGASGLAGLDGMVGGDQYTDYLASLTGLSIDMAQSHAFLGSKVKLGSLKLQRNFKTNVAYRQVRAAEMVASVSSLFTKKVDYR